MFPLDDTIAAIASAAGGALRGIVRISGPGCVSIISRVGDYDRPLHALTQPTCFPGTINLSHGLGPVPFTLYLWPTIKSYTREPTAELHLPGSPPVLNAALDAVCAAGARLAQPGEFTLRAFLAGRLDLTQAEAVLGVIDASDRRQLETALQQLAGGLARPLARLRERLLDCLAHLEAGLDFVEEDIEFITEQALSQELTDIERQIEGLLAQMASRTQSSQLPRVVLYGLANTGKSSLLNALAGDAVALVSPLAGTTRDYVARRVKFYGRELLLSDTAGLSPAYPVNNREGDNNRKGDNYREGEAPAEPLPPRSDNGSPGRGNTPALDQAMQETTSAELARADLVLLCIDASRTLEAWETNELARPAQRRLIVKTKCDLPSSLDSPALAPALSTSSTTGTGLEKLKESIVAALESNQEEAGVVAGTAERCRDSLHLAAQALARARSAANQRSGDELTAAEIRLALDELGRVVGAVYTEDILDRVFTRFCIGK